MKISQRGIDLITEFEGYSATAYQDSVGVWTLGYGHTRGVKSGDTCTPETARVYLADDLVEAEHCIDAYVDVELTQGQYDSLCSFVFNLGCKAFRNSSLLKLINAGEFEAARAQFARWSKAGGVVLAGLTRRRAAEAEMFG